MRSYLVKTLGCKANLYDSQIIEQSLQAKGWQPASGEEEGEASSRSSPIQLCIINSCTVTDEADRQSRKWAARLARENPGAKIVITGCGAEVDPEGMAHAQGVDFVVGNQNKDQIVDLIDHLDVNISSDILKQRILGTTKTYKELQSKHPMDREWPAVLDSFKTPPVHLEGHSDKTRSFIKIQEGCNSFCTYCIIPFGRGPSRSLRPRELIAQVNELVEQGVREIVLTGTNIGDYGTDWEGSPQLGALIRMILEYTDLERLRVSSLDPTEITPEIFELMAHHPRLCPHFHVSLQSPHSRILRLMKRRYGYNEVKRCLESIAQIAAGQPGGVFVGMDVITGFPGETESEFEWTVEALTSLPWSRLHVFPYSERAGTPATRLPASVPQADRVARTQILNRLSLDRLKAHYTAVLEVFKKEQAPLLNGVLLEKLDSRGWQAGFTANYLRVMIPGSKSTAQSGDVVAIGASRRNQLASVMPRELMVDSRGYDVALVCDLV